MEPKEILIHIFIIKDVIILQMRLIMTLIRKYEGMFKSNVYTPLNLSPGAYNILDLQYQRCLQKRKSPQWFVKHRPCSSPVLVRRMSGCVVS